MKKILGVLVGAVFVLSLFVMASPVQAATNWDTTGSYVVAFEYLGPTYAHDMTLSQDGLDNLTGSGGHPAGGPFVYTWVIDSGTVVGNTINLTAHYTASADAVVPLTTMTMTGTIAGDGSMSGTWTDNYQGGSRGGTWTTTSGNANKSANTVVVSGDTAAGENQPGWLFNRDLANVTPYNFSLGNASIGLGSLNVLPIGANAADKFIGENFINTPIADVDSISYDFKIGSGGVDTEEEQFYMNVYANFGVSDDLKYYDCRYDILPTVGSTAGFTTVTFDPTQSYPVTTRTGGSASPFTCPSIPADMDTLSAGSNIRMFALNVGDTSASDIGLDGYLDKIVTDASGLVTTYDFEPTLTEVVSGGGHISLDGSKPTGKKQWTFSVEIKVDEQWNTVGYFNLVDHPNQETCNYDVITNLVINGNTATFDASGAEGCPDLSDVTIVDVAEPGAGVDQIAFPGQGLRTITGGNFQVDSLPGAATFTASDSSYYNGMNVSDGLYGTGPIWFTWNTSTGNVTGGLWEEIVPPTSGTHYFNNVVSGTVIGGAVNLTLQRIVPDAYGPFSLNGTLVGNTLTGTAAGPYLFIATGTITP